MGFLKVSLSRHNKAFTDASKGRIRQSLTALVIFAGNPNMITVSRDFSHATRVFNIYVCVTTSCVFTLINPVHLLLMVEVIALTDPQKISCKCCRL